MRRSALTVTLVACVLAPAGTGAAAAAAATGRVPVLVVDGRGFGHGVGMAQDGAYWMGRDGADVAAILGHFYPGTMRGRATGPVRVTVYTGRDAQVGFPTGGEIRGDGEGFPVRMAAGEQAKVRADGNRVVVTVARPAGTAHAPGPGASVPSTAPTRPPATTTTTRPSPLPTLPFRSARTTTVPVPAAAPDAADVPPPPAADTAAVTPPTATAPTTATATATAPTTATATAMTVQLLPHGTDGTVAVDTRQRRYRGVIAVTAAAGSLHLVNQVDVEQYLRGMGEVRDPSWPPAALQAQAIAARTYALRAMALAGGLCDTQRCQVYLGQQAEYTAMDRAVAQTAGQVLTYGRQLASTVYSANAGGTSASRAEGFGVDDSGHPYLRPGPYVTHNPMPWTVQLAMADVARRTSYPGTLTTVEVTRRGPSGRALEVTLDGSAGPVAVTGLAMRAALGVRSTLFDVRTEMADTAPHAPPAAEVQLLPEELAAAGAARVAGRSPWARAARSRATGSAVDTALAEAQPASGDSGSDAGLARAAFAVSLGLMAAAAVRRRRENATYLPAPGVRRRSDGSG